MSIRYLAALAALALVTFASGLLPSWSQDDAPKRDRGGDGGGRGGFGGGGFGGGFGGGPGGGMMGGMIRPDNMMTDLLRIETVRAEIKLMPDQEEALKKLPTRPRGERPNFNFGEASEAEQKSFMEKMQAEMAKRSAETKEQLEEILLPAQFERLEQLAVQARGPMGIVSHADTAKAISVSTEQSDKMKAEVKVFGESMREKIGEMFRSGGGDREAMAAKMKETRKEIEGKLLAILDDNQKAEFEKLKGDPFELPDMAMGGGRGFGGPGGRGGDRGAGGERGGRDRPAAE